MALINSNSIKGRCPICGMANCACKGEKTYENGVIITKFEPGATQLYDLGNGCFIKLTEKQARERGLIKMQEPGKNKMRQPAKNKGVKPS